MAGESPTVKVSPLDAWRQFKRRPLEFIDGLVARDEPVVQVDIGPRRVCVVADRGLADELLAARAGVAGRPRTMNRVLCEAAGGPSLTTVAGGEWKARRRLLSPAFSKRRAAESRPEIARIVDDELAGWPVDRPFGLAAASRRLTLRIALSSMFGMAGSARQLAERMAVPFEEANQHVTRRIYSVVRTPPWLPTAANRSLRRKLANLRHVVGAAAAGWPVGPSSALERIGSTDGAMIYDEDGLVTELLGLLFAGHQPSAAGLTWTLTELAMQPELWDRAATDPDAATHAVMEALRLHPPVWGLIRQAAAPIELGGQPFRRGTYFIVPVWSLHRHAAGRERPGEYCPARFADGAGKSDTAPFVPFGLGPRHCIGGHLAMEELSTAVTAVTRRFRPGGLSPRPPGHTVHVTLEADPEPQLLLHDRA